MFVQVQTNKKSGWVTERGWRGVYEKNGGTNPKMAERREGTLGAERGKKQGWWN